MTKLRLYILLLIFSGISYRANAQYLLRVVAVDKDSAFAGKHIPTQSFFKNIMECSDYINRLPSLLQVKGFPTASIDSVHYDSTLAFVTLFFGASYQVGHINIDSVDKKILERAGWNERDYINKPLDPARLELLQKKILDYLENNGYPFAKIQLDSLRFEDENFYATLKVSKGPLYKIDSIRTYGDVNISNNFLQHYLDITNGSIYQKSRLQNIHKKILELPYVQEIQPWDLTMLGTGSIVNLYLKPKKSSQINALIGFLPNNEQSGSNKLRITGEANLNLRNALGNGEMIGLNWQQLQAKAPRLNIIFEQPYMFGTPFGITSSFDLFKKDSSFINIGLLFGIQYTLSANETGKVFIQNLRTNLLTIDTFFIKNNKRLPDERDVSSINLGVDYDINKTNYRFNPGKGSEARIIASAGTRKIRKNNVILKLSSPDFSYESLYDSVKLNTYQFRIKLAAAHYFPLGHQATLKTSVNTGLFQSPTIYRNELFQIGGYRLLRGFDEESIYVSQYAVGTLEYRYLIGLNSFLFTFIDVGLTKDKSLNKNLTNNFIGGGGGLAFETKAGIFNISLAAGKRNDIKFDLRQSKIHLGYVSYF